MAIVTNFTNLKGNTGNSLRVISTTPGAAAGEDTVVILGEFLADGTVLFVPSGTCVITGQADQTIAELHCTDLDGTWTVADPAGTIQSTRAVVVQGGIRGVRLHSGTPTPIGGIDADGSAGITEVADSLVGDIFLETDEDRLYERVADNPGETWNFLSDFTGQRGASIANVTGTPEAVQFVDSDGATVGPAFNLKGNTGESGLAAAVKNITSDSVETTPVIPRVDGRVSLDLSGETSTSAGEERSSFVFDINKYTTDVGGDDGARNTLRIFSRIGAEAGYGFSGADSDFNQYQNYDVSNDPFNGEATIDAMVTQIQAGNTSVFQDGTANDAVWQISFTKTSATTGFFTGPAGADLTATVNADTLGITGATIAAVPEVPAVFTEQISSDVVLNNNDTLKYTNSDGTTFYYKYVGVGETLEVGDTLPPVVSDDRFRLI